MLCVVFVQDPKPGCSSPDNKHHQNIHVSLLFTTLYLLHYGKFFLHLQVPVL
jgi:hypothetical protein